MNKLIVAVALCAALAACKKEEPAAPADAAAPAADAAMSSDPAAAPADAMASDPAAAPAADAAAPAQAGLPKECEDYINRVKACVAKSGGNAAAAQFQTSLDQTKAQWEAAADKSTLVPACTQANDQFAQTAAMMKCE